MGKHQFAPPAVQSAAGVVLFVVHVIQVALQMGGFAVGQAADRLALSGDRLLTVHANFVRRLSLFPHRRTPHSYLKTTALWTPYVGVGEVSSAAFGTVDFECDPLEADGERDERFIRWCGVAGAHLGECLGDVACPRVELGGGGRVAVSGCDEFENCAIVLGGISRVLKDDEVRWHGGSQLNRVAVLFP